MKTENRRSSKGNQLKWEAGEYWYKADSSGYEGLSEYSVSHLLLKSSLSQQEFVLYEPETIRYKRQTYSGVKSRNFLPEGFTIITLERFFKNISGESLNSIIYKTPDHEQRLRTIVELVERSTGLEGFGIYMQKLLAIDALFLNEDRHTHNIALLMDSGNNFKLCPIFDNGASLLADTTMDYPLGADIYELISEVKARTFSDSFEEQLEIAEKLYGNNLSFSFTHKDVNGIVDSATNYPEEIRARVKEILYSQMKKYSYMFK